MSSYKLEFISPARLSSVVCRLSSVVLRLVFWTLLRFDYCLLSAKPIGTANSQQRTMNGVAESELSKDAVSGCQ